MTQMTIPQAMELALREQNAGRLQQAESIYRQIVAAIPNHADAWHMLGMLAMQVGQVPAALELIDKSIELFPQQAGYHANRAQVLAAAGRWEEAVEGYRKALSIDPNLIEALNNLGNLYRQRGDLDSAIDCYRAGLEIRPDMVNLAIQLAITLSSHNRFREAADAWRKILQMSGDDPDIWNNLGNSLQGLGDLDEAIDAYHKAISLRAEYPEAYSNLGNALLEQGNASEAIAMLNRSIALRANQPGAHYNLGNALSRVWDLEGAEKEFRISIEQQPDYAQPHNGLGGVLHATGNYAQATEEFRKAIQYWPNCAEAHFNLAIEHLLRGEFREGWAEHDWRWLAKRYSAFRIQFPQPRWDGDSLEGKRILLHAEQGFGDVLQFIRYVPMVASKGGTIILRCQPELQRLLKDVPGIAEIFSVHDELPAFDTYSPLLSLPRVFDTTLENIPAQVPYLKADADLINQWKQRMGKNDSRLKVGLVWAGRPEHVNDVNRSMSLETLAPLANATNARFFSLQKNGGPSSSDSAPTGLELVDLTNDIADFADAAALVENLDLVITVDTATAHLAGALGKPVWTLLPFVPDWRWMLDRTDSPWYPTMRLFRQSARGDWTGSVNAVAESLKTFTS